ncbi:magnesium transporter [Geosmithia morbida]|uniref:Magnesium transporter n=1 Tax=Geosmithia morbida TaxID=1094350 RepID=A0A9P4YWJ3_9HYPO|nr:magnesium transporter [Geosmithia morbida]KAF4124170.1 magnesium transporter [Geosmithia morbida]
MSSNPFNILGSSSRPPPPQSSTNVLQSRSSRSAEPQQQPQQQPDRAPKKRKGHRGGKKKRQRRKSFAVIDEDDQRSDTRRPSGSGFYQMPTSASGTSLDSEALLDHSEQKPMRARRTSTITGLGAPSTSSVFTHNNINSGSRLQAMEMAGSSDEDEGDDFGANDEGAPLLSEPVWNRRPSSYGANDSRMNRPRSRAGSSILSHNAKQTPTKEPYDVNNPPSVPASPQLGAVDRLDMTLGDVMIRDEIDSHDGSPHLHIEDNDDAMSDVAPAMRDNRPVQRVMTGRSGEEDVCFPGPGMSEVGDEDIARRSGGRRGHFRPQRRRGQWPDLSKLEEWKHMEKEDRSEERRVKTITEPQLINGRLRPVRKGWFETDEDIPYRFTYFNEEFRSTIHSQTISELVQPGGGFEELFIPEPRTLSDDESDTDEELLAPIPVKNAPPADNSNMGTRQTSVSDHAHSNNVTTATTTRGFSPKPELLGNNADSGRGTPTLSGTRSPEGSTAKRTQSQTREYETNAKSQTPLQEGDRPVWWLDVFCPTEAEMKVISKAFGIHPLTAEDIMLQEAREKVELFRNYYFVNYRTFDQDINSENYLEPVNMYVVVFREGVLSFHFSVTPHPANVRRRIRQLRDYLILSSDWISYAIIDDITDVFQPLIQNIEEEVDAIDDAILRLHSVADRRLKAEKVGPSVQHDDSTTVNDSAGDMDMLRRVGDCRKRVMSLYRLLGNKADVIKGFAKRCNERWEVAPRSEIGLYLGDIQDHIVTMTSNLGHYEKILARSHGNYLAQINIRMNERQEQTADVLGKLTVLGTIVLPMNIITGLWGMNVWVPGQEYEGDLVWFMGITAGLLLFGLGCYVIAKRVYGIV